MGSIIPAPSIWFTCATEYSNHPPCLSAIPEDPDFDAKPMILLVGQYSTGKTTFIRHLLERDFPGIRIGPEPTTGNRDILFYKLNSPTIGRTDKQ